MVEVAVACRRVEIGGAMPREPAGGRCGRDAHRRRGGGAGRDAARVVRRLITERRIAFSEIGRHVRLSASDLDAFIRAGRVEPWAGQVIPRSD